MIRNTTGVSLGKLLEDTVYIRRPLEKELDLITKTLIEIMENISISCNSKWSFVGGFARDMYLGKPYNDYDICIQDTEKAKILLTGMGLLENSLPEGREVPHDYYSDPYEFVKKKYPVHFIYADDIGAYAPREFDFTMNQIALMPDGYFYAPTYTWRDLDNKKIRMARGTFTVNTLLRAIRFSFKYNFTIDEEILKLGKEVIEEPIDTLLFLRNLRKMIEDEVGEQCFNFMKEFGFLEVLDSKTIEECVALQQQMIEDGTAVIREHETLY